MALSDAQISLARLYLADQGTSAMQFIQIDNATSGTFTVSLDGQTTADIDFAAGANAVQNALCTLSNIGVGGVNVVLGNPIVGSVVYDIAFAGDLEHVAQPMFTVDATTLNVGALATVAQAVAGGAVTFSDDELNALYTDAGASFNLMIAKGFDVLAAFGAKFNDYVAGQSQEKKSQVEANIVRMQLWWHQWAIAGHQVQIVSLQGEPPRLTAVPVQPGVPATALQYAPPYGTGWGRAPWRRGLR